MPYAIRIHERCPNCGEDLAKWDPPEDEPAAPAEGPDAPRDRLERMYETERRALAAPAEGLRDEPVDRLRRALNEHPNATYVRVEAIDLRAALTPDDDR